MGGTILSLRVGLPEQLGLEGAADPLDRSWSTGSFKQPVAGPIWLGRTNLVGDGQADRKHHGGPDKAVCAYPAAHYPLWQAELGLPDFPFGAFGENVTLDELTEQDVCIGDAFAIGEARVQISQPRQPCWKLSRRWRVKDLALRVQLTGRTGWYLRVLAEGYVAPHQPIRLLDRPFPGWTVAHANAVMHDRQGDREAAADLAACPLLSANWRATLTARANGLAPVDPRRRLAGSA